MKKKYAKDLKVGDKVTDFHAQSGFERVEFEVVKIDIKTKIIFLKKLSECDGGYIPNEDGLYMFYTDSFTPWNLL